VITEVHQLGFRVSAVAVEYSSTLSLAGSQVPPSAFEVVAQLGTDTGPRTVVNAYTNRVASTTDRPMPGQFVILELDPDDPNASVTYDDNGTQLHPLEGAYTVTQVEDLIGPNGKVRVPGPGDPISNEGLINPVVDDFEAASYTGTSGTTLQYRLFSPDAPGLRGDAGDVQQGRTYPLVVFLHGGGERGSNNITQIVANEGAVAFARPERQATDPSFVLAPQAPAGTLWTTPHVLASLEELIQHTIESYPIDTDRIYVTGLSLGAWGMYNGLFPNNPSLFAGGIAIAGLGNPALAPSYAHVPIWATHSRDDGVLPWFFTDNIMTAIEDSGAVVTRAEWAGNLDKDAAEEAARSQVAAAAETGSHTLFTTFTAGTTPFNPHFSWVPTYSNDVILDWLFDQSRAH
jgi:predicted peptidase